MSLQALILRINNQEKKEKERIEKTQKHAENMKRHKYRVQQKNKQKTKNSQKSALKNATKKFENF